MGNIQRKEIDILDLYMRDPVLRYNVSRCVNETVALDPARDVTSTATSKDWAHCLGVHAPGALISRPYVMPALPQAAWAAIFAAMIAVAVAGNAIVVWIIVAHRRMRTITNLFLLNLAIADFLMASGNATFNFVFMLESHWPFGEVFCVGSNFLANLTVSTSVFTILAMSIDRSVICSFFVCVQLKCRSPVGAIFSLCFVRKFMVSGTSPFLLPTLNFFFMTFMATQY